ncbi:MAG: glycosyltransferase [Planctomycetota bacterium]|nr:glycosyltransferase [Planctomycetota bacterium]
MTRILYVTDNPPWPTDYGGAQRSTNIQRALRACGDVEMLLLVPPDRITPEVEDVLRRDWDLAAKIAPIRRSMHWPWRAIRPLHPRVVATLAHHLGHQGLYYQPDPNVSSWVRRRALEKPYDLIVGRFLRITAQAGSFDIAPVILDADDLDTVVYRSRRAAGARGPIHDWALGRQLTQIEAIEARLLRQCAHVFVASDRDRELIGHNRVSTLPNIPFPPELADAPVAPDSAASNVVTYVASMGHRPNIRGLEWFLDLVWPEIRRLRPATVFRTVGGGMSPDLLQRCKATPGLEPVGRVDSVGAAYAASALTVSPVNDGAGTKIKVIESLLHGRACVSTSHSWRGYEATLPKGEAIAIADDPKEFAREVVRLLNDFPARQAMARRGYEQVKLHYTFPRVERTVREAVESVLSARRARMSASGGAKQPEPVA